MTKASPIEKALEKCVELGKLLSQTEQYQAVKKAEHDLMHNSEARNLLENLQQLQQEQLKKQMAGMELTAEEKKKLSETEQTAIQNPLVRASHLANADFQDLMKEISNKIREGIRLSS